MDGAVSSILLSLLGVNTALQRNTLGVSVLSFVGIIILYFCNAVRGGLRESGRAL